MEPGASVSIISGLITNGSGANVMGAVSVVSGVVSIASGTIGISGLTGGFSGAQTFLSGGAAVSGVIPVLPVMYDYSGAQWVPMSTSQSGSTFQQNYIQAAQPAAFVWAPLSGIGFGAGATNSGIPSLSGGVALSSGRVNKAIVRNLSGNADMYVGGSGSKPFSGFGFVLHGGDGLTLDIPNFNQIYLFANTSGQLVSYIGTAF